MGLRYKNEDSYIREYKSYLLFFLGLLASLLYLTNPVSLLAEWIRIGFLLLCLLPVLYKKNVVIFTIVPMLCISLASFCPMLPTSSSYYILIIPIVTLYIVKIKVDSVIKHAFLVLAYYYTVSLIYGDRLDFAYWVIIALLIISCIKDKVNVEYMSTAFMLTSLGICLLYLFFAKYFLVQITSSAEGGYERSQWLNPNELAGMINCGGVIAAGYLTGFFKHSKESRYTFFLQILTITLVAIINFINASRGGTITFVSMILLFGLYSKMRLKYKVFLVIGIGLVLGFAFNEGIMDTLIYRLNEDNLKTAGSRTGIWAIKLNAFFNELSFPEMLFGIGATRTINIGIFYSTHNDFVTALVGYGFIGLALYISIFYYIIKKTMKKNRLKVIALLLFIVLEASSLEFFFRGYLVLLLFLFFISRYFSIQNNKL